MLIIGFIYMNDRNRVNRMWVVSASSSSFIIFLLFIRRYLGSSIYKYNISQKLYHISRSRRL